MLSGLYMYNSMFFGYQPMAGKILEVSAGSILFDNVREIIDKMHNPAALPLFYFRPSDGVFVMQIRDGKDNSETNVKRPKVKAEITSESQLKDYLPLLCSSGSEAYQMSSDTSGLTSHFTVTGNDRATGLTIKATATNPYWHALDNYDFSSLNDYITKTSTKQLSGMDDHKQSISNVFGHIGYKRRSYHAVGNYIVDMHGAFSYAVSRLWWLMRPAINISGLSVYGIIDGLDDGLLYVDLTGLPYNKCLLKQSSISYNANEGTVISKFSVYVFPPWHM